MAKCKYCGKGGLFTALDPNGLCSKCVPVVKPQIQSQVRVVMDSLKLAQEGKTFSTRLSRCDLLAERAAALVEFERKGIPTISPLPSELVRTAADLRKNIIIDFAREAAKSALDKAEVATTPRARVNAFSKGYLKAKEILDQGNEPRLGAAILADLKSRAHKAELDGYLEAARKAEFKGNHKKAIDQYQEALFFIKNDDIPDDQQAAEIRTIEGSLRKLQRS